MFSPMKEPDSLSEDKSKGDEFKKVADENDMTEDQFYACFVILIVIWIRVFYLNKLSGLEAKNEIFNCYNKPLEEEMKEYMQWFKKCPVGTFPEYTVEGINDVFCEMNVGDQEYCEKGGNQGRCDRMRAGALLERYIAEGKCETVVNEVPKPPMER
ncbi:uncharacterized protein CDAR_266001 [Caerostris darwini]|uniref:Uncharacterized protein n=1 Tax=Caerostris darwini TaxID=1538125 RepID=A0AAV4QW30_9ARAC|nr:uncharacterized protein CDAR_266001 [Caerostris darwini]